MKCRVGREPPGRQLTSHWPSAGVGWWRRPPRIPTMPMPTGHLHRQGRLLGVLGDLVRSGGRILEDHVVYGQDGLYAWPPDDATPCVLGAGRGRASAQG